MKKYYEIITVGCIIVAIVVISWAINTSINIGGISETSLEKEAREAGDIKDTWDVVMETSDTGAILLFYSPDLEQSTYHVYVKNEGNLGGYHFRRGGSREYMEDYIVSIELEDNTETAYISLNKQQIAEIEVKTKHDVQIEDIQPDEPFAIIVRDSAEVIFRDVGGKEVTCIPEDTLTILSE